MANCIKIRVEHTKLTAFILDKKVESLTSLLAALLSDGSVAPSSHREALKEWLYTKDENGNLVVRAREVNSIANSLRMLKVGINLSKLDDSTKQKLLNSTLLAEGARFTPGTKPETIAEVLMSYVPEEGFNTSTETFVTSTETNEEVEEIPNPETVETPVETEVTNAVTGDVETKTVVTSLEDDVNKVFGNYALLENYRVSDFNTAMLYAMQIYQADKGAYYQESTSNEQLNTMIQRYKAGELEVLINFINSQVPDSEKIVKRDKEGNILYTGEGANKKPIIEPLYKEKDGTNKSGTVNRELLEKVIKSFESLVELGVVSPDSISGWWENKYFDHQEPNNQWHAACAYLTLKHFDESLTSAKLNSIIRVNMAPGIEIDKFDFSGKPINKYTIGKDKSHLIKNWNIGEYRNAVKENSKLAMLVIGSIDKYQYHIGPNKPTPIIGKLSVTEIANAWSHLVASVKLLKAANITRTNNKNFEVWRDDMYKNILKVSDDPQFHMKKVLDILFKGTAEGKTDFQDALLSDQGLNYEDYNILYSVWRHEIDTNSTRIKAQNNTLSSSSVKEFLKSDIIYSVIRKNNAVNYLTTIWDPASGSYKTKYIAKSDQVFRNKMNYLRGKSAELASAIPENLREILANFDVKRVPTDNDPNKFKPNQLEITLDGKRFRLVLTLANKSLGASDATSYFHIIPVDTDPDLIDKISKLLEADNNENLKNGELQENPYSARIDSALTSILNKVKNDKKPSKEREEAAKVIATALGIYSNTYNEGIEFSKLSLEDKTDIINAEFKKIKEGLNNPYDDALNSKLGIETRNNVLNKNEETKELNSLMEFMDSFLTGLDLLSEEGLITLNTMMDRSKASVKPGEASVPRVTLRQVMSEAAMLAYKMTLQAEAGDNNLKTYVESQDPILSKAIDEGKVLRMIKGKPRFNALSNSDWLERFFDAKTMTDGNATMATTKGRDGNSKANYVPASLSDHINEQWEDRRNYTSKNSDTAPLATNLVITNEQLVVDIARDSSFASMYDEKNTKTATPGELIFHGIVNNFFNAMNTNDGKVAILPTVYSDKTAFINFMVDLNKKVKVIDKTLWQLTAEESEQLYAETVIPYYYKQFHASINKFVKLFEFLQDNPDSNPNENLKNILTTFDAKNATSASVNNILRNIDQKLLEELIRVYNANNEKILEFAVDSDYRKQKGYLSLNEIAADYARMYETEDVDETVRGDMSTRVKASDKLKARFKQEKLKYIKGLLQQNVNFYYDESSPLYQVVHSSRWTTAAGVNFADFDTNWVHYGNLVLAKDSKGNNIYDINDLPEDGNIEMNPLLEKQYYIDTIMSSNIKYATVGDEISDPLKAGLNMQKDFNADSVNSDGTKKSDTDIQELGKLSAEELDFLQHTDLTTLGMILSGEDDKFPKIRNNAYVKATYDKLIYRCISTSEGSQYKRNVIIPGSGIYYNLNSLSGIGATTKISYFDDPQSEVFNVAGARSDGEDAQDGSAQENPIMAILENCSLNADAVGYRYKKPIWYIYDDDMGCSRLIKYAVHTIHNDVMRNSNGSTTSMYKLFKKMCNITWDQEYDLLHSCGTAYNSTLQFIDVIRFCKDDEGNPTGLYYEDIDKRVFAITNFERDPNGHYITTEVDVTNVSKTDEDSDSHVSGNTYYVMHVFNENDEDVKIKSHKGEKKAEFIKRAHTEAIVNNYHNIKSIYQLHQAMGGIYSVKRVNGATNKFVPAESSNYAVAAFLNNVSILKPEYVGRKREEIPATQEAYEQPLKKFMIGYAVLKSASKRHTTNINSVDTLNNDKALLYSEVSNKGHCIQQDPTHTADEAELTEMSQVIASLDVGGKLHDIAAEAFKGLGKLIIDKLNLKEKLINAFQKANLSPQERLQVTEKLYDVVVREFLDQYQARSKTDLAASIVEAIKRNFGADALFRDADFKLPISDPNIFRQIVSTFISSVNTALKRKYSGIGDVMTPGFNQFQIYRLKNENGEDMDLLLDDVFSSHAHKAAKSILVNQYNPDTIVQNAVAKPYKKLTSVGENNAWFLTLEDGFEFNPNAETKEERYGGHHGVEIVQHNDNPYEYEIHFKNDINTPWTKLEKTTYYLALNKFLNLKKIEAGPNKAITVVLTGEVSKGGFSGFNRLHQFGLVPTGKYRPVSLKDTEIRSEVLERWKNTYQDPQAYLNAIEDKDVRENTLNDWNSKLLNRTTNLEKDVLAPEFEFKYALLNPVEIQMKALGDNDAQIRQTMLNMYFAQEQEKVDAAGNKVYYKDINEFSPSDNIILDDVNGNPIHLDLSNIDTYFAVKNCLHFHNYTLRDIINTICLNSNIALNIYLSTPEYRKTLLNKINEALKEDNKELTLADTKALPLETLINLIYSNNLNSRLDVAKPSNLKPQLITFKIETAEGIKTYNLYDLDYIRSKHQKQGSRKANYDPEVDRVIDKLVKEGKANIGGLEYNVVPNSIDNREAEALMTDIHKSKFKQSSNSLYEQLTNFESKTLNGINSDFADIVLAGKRNLGLTFHDSNAVPVNLDLKVLDEDIVHEDDKILIYAKNRKSQERTYMIGWYDLTDYQVRKKVVGEVTTYSIVNANEQVIEQTPDLQIIGGKVYRKEYIVQKLGGFNNSTLRDETIINICPDKLRDYLRKYSKEWEIGENNDQLVAETQAEIIKNLARYNQSTHLQLVLNTHSKNNLILKVLPILKEARDSNAKYWNDCIEKNIQYIDALDESAASTINDTTIKRATYLGTLRIVHHQFIDEIKASHNLARFFVAARIPAQSLQSYMKMRCVGFLQGTDNLVIVSHFQTWLQGSDYK